jgi:hypothetical protein
MRMIADFSTVLIIQHGRREVKGLCVHVDFALRGIAGLAGGITPGTLADLLLRDANPLDNIRNTRRIVAVVRRGRLFTRKNLDALLASARRNAATPVRR